LTVKALLDSSVGFVIEASQTYGGLPWVLGFSGGKDSTVTLHVIVEAVRRGARLEHVYVVYEDTLLEHPLLRHSALKTLESLSKLSKEELGGVIEPVVLKPASGEDFISMMVLKGYPMPGPRFRWCMRVLKLNPLKRFVKQLGDFIMVSGVRLGESVYRRANLTKMEYVGDAITRVRFAGRDVVAVMPILFWRESHVFKFLFTEKRWDGRSYDYLLKIYKLGIPCNKLEGGHIDVRFGCWVCTVVRKEKMPIPEEIVKVKNQLLDITKRSPQYREGFKGRLGKLSVEGRRAVAEIFLKVLQDAPGLFGYNVENLESCLKAVIQDYGKAEEVCRDLY